MRKLDIERTERQIEALNLRKIGLQYDEIAKRLGYSDKSGAWRSVKAALDRRVSEAANEMRIIQDERLDLLLSRVLTAVLQGDLDRVTTVLQIEKRRADLWGLDAPKGVEVTGASGGPIVTDVGSLLRQRLDDLEARSTGSIVSAQQNAIESGVIPDVDE